MGKDTYIILRIQGVERTSSVPLESLNLRMDSLSSDAPELEYRIESATLDRKEFQELRRDPQVKGIARPIPLRLIAPVSDAGPSAEPAHIHDATWGVFVTGALKSPYIGRNVTVAVLDTGIDATHEAFRGVELVQKDFTGEGNGDQDGHGTHVAGTIFGRAVQGPRYAVAPGVRRALIGKVLGNQRSATTQELVAAIQWAVAEGAHIINMSIGIDFPGFVKQLTQSGMEVDLATSRALAAYRDNIRLFDRLLYLLSANTGNSSGALIIAAAGNESRRDIAPGYTIDVSSPAAADGVISVAALQTQGPPHEALKVALFSNTGAAVAAPGVDIYSAKAGGGYTLLSGTSMASPHVAGVAALWAERQIQHNGSVRIRNLDAQLRGRTRQDRLQGQSEFDIGEGLVSAPQE